LSENVACDAAAKKEACAGILLGESREAFTSGIEIASAFDTEISAVSVFDQDVKAKFTRGGIRTRHKQLLSR